jgi:putative flippase GtrA
MSLSQAIRFGAVGLINTLVGLSAIYALKLFVGAGDVVANLLGYAVGVTVSFALNRKWTFAFQGDHWQASLRFVATMAMSYAVNLSIVLVALHVFKLNSYLAQALGIPPYTIVSFLLCKYWVFRAPPA